MPTPIPIDTSRRPAGLDFDEQRRVWWGSPGDEELGISPTWTLDLGPSEGDTHWLPYYDMPAIEPSHCAR
jgi:hypothetical protein